MNRQIFLFALLLTGLFALLTTASAQATNHPAYLSIPIAASQKAVDFIRTVRPQTQPQDVEQLVPLTVSKMPQPSVLPEPGGPVTFTITVTNTLSLRAVEITRLEDSIYGDVTQAGHDGVVATNCQVPQSLPILVGTYQCTFIARVQGNAGDKHENRLEVYIRNNESDELAGGGSATVTLTDLPSSLAIEKQAAVTSVPEAGATVVFTAVITNTSAVDRVQVKTLKDDHFGDVATDCTPKLPANLQPQAMITCHFSGFVREEAGGIHTNTVTVNGTDDDGNPVSANDSLTLTINDTPAVLTVSKVATPTTLAEPGGPVTFTVTVRNDSAADGILLTTLLDDQFGDVADSCQPALPTRLEPNAELTCTFTRPVTGQPATAHVNTVTTSGVSTDNVIVTADASATVTFLDQPSGIALVQSPNPATAPPNGGVVTFTVEVSNTSPVDAVTVETLVDSVYGDVTTPNPKLLTTNCSTPQTLAVGQEYVCQFSAQFSGPVRATQTHTLTVTATDDDGGALSAQAAATITIVGPLLRASKTVALINDQNGDNVASPGDALGYTVVIANQGNGADQVRLSDVVDPNTQILPQSVTTTQGIITASPPSMSVELGELGPAGVVTVSFTAQIVDPLPLGVSTVSNQGIVIGNLSPAIPTDDPTTPAVDDATATLVVAQPLLLAAKRVTLAGLE